jgi:serpin B
VRPSTLVASLIVAACVLGAGCGTTGSRSRASDPVVPAARVGVATELVASAPSPAAANAAAATRAVASGEQAFSLALLHQLGAAADGGNVTVSPASLAVALAMLETGAGGATRAQIASTLGASSLSTTAQDLGWAALLSQLGAATGKAGINFDSANGMWLATGLPMEPSFMAAMAGYFRSGVWQVDFAHQLPAAQAAINQWVDQRTRHKILSLFKPGDLSTETQLVLANAVYFNAKWQDQFDPAASGPGTFFSGSGSQPTVTFMRQPHALGAMTSSYEAVQVPYAGGRLAALAIMPTAQSLPAFVNTLTTAGLAHIAATSDQPVRVSLPRFRVEDYVNLNATLQALGMPLAFSDLADLSAMSPIPLKVQSVAQRDYLSVAEQGTEAAAATGISAVPAAAIEVSASLDFDHPFLFLVRDTGTGTILFATEFQGPT